ncbi:hypothetical protein FZI85_27780 [Mycobacterium sp. CBMA293]|uniref:Uncharacterized protein n=1 Tax=Mycolicibacterium sp. CBMA 213 TaxID=1968788 RepID=A0A1S6GKU8_9MYCO|nr:MULTISPECIES: hypothetical protein [unclassified Mycolicibacterium]AQS22495.1 hypothetical protein pCBMA213_2_00131 [Mycolicibacterium sp. CBMA 213]MUL48394.1 hypothetical protein [Mycolicibacterium sp. CBMA 360]MUL62406.1 hypothetical protein [Mycolicibacterium sp. CBMA 335]MUM14806.1 hypothetical protein [Mycolicibacterium sp. CBMA 293]
MTDLITTVYLNTADQHLRGFDVAEPARLEAAASFTLPFDGRPTPEAVKAALETVFDQLNIDFTQPWSKDWTCRSLSVGDVVVIGETAWAVAPSGWTALSCDQLSDAIAR